MSSPFIGRAFTLTINPRLNSIFIGPKIQGTLWLRPRARMSSLRSAITSSLKAFATRSHGGTSIPWAQEKQRTLPTGGFNTIDVGQPVEEEELPDYRPDRFYPVQLGQVFGDRYQTIAKLGFGSSSTIWLARDLR